MDFKEYIDYRFIEENDKSHYDYVIKIRIKLDEDESDLIWYLGILNNKIAEDESYYKDIAKEYVQKYRGYTQQYSPSLIEYIINDKI